MTNTLASLLRHGQSLDFHADESDLAILQAEELRARAELVHKQAARQALDNECLELEQHANKCAETYRTVMQQIIADKTKATTGVSGFAFSPPDQK